MTILVTGATGKVGSRVVARLAQRGVEARALVRDPAKAKLPQGVEPAKGDMLDVDALRAALDGVSTLFVLNAVVADELTQALIPLNLAHEAGIERIVYFSVSHVDQYVDVPHFAAKHAAERMIERTGMHATILRPAYFMQNDLSMKDAIVDQGVYAMPIGDKGIAMVDLDDIAEIATIEILRRDRSAEPLPLDHIHVVGPENLTGGEVARIWTDVLGRQVAYGGNDTAAFETAARQFAPSWLAFDMRKMADRFVSDGMAASADEVDRMTRMLGRPLRTYREFAAATITDKPEE